MQHVLLLVLRSSPPSCLTGSTSTEVSKFCPVGTFAALRSGQHLPRSWRLSPCTQLACFCRFPVAASKLSAAAVLSGASVGVQALRYPLTTEVVRCFPTLSKTLLGGLASVRPPRRLFSSSILLCAVAYLCLSAPLHVCLNSYRRCQYC